MCTTNVSRLLNTRLLTHLQALGLKRHPDQEVRSFKTQDPEKHPAQYHMYSLRPADIKECPECLQTTVLGENPPRERTKTKTQPT